MREGDGLRGNADFLKLWGGQTVSVLGSQITLVALPLTAVLLLDAGAVEMGLLRAFGTVPTVLFSLAVGVWLDRVRRRPVLIASSLGSALFLGLVPALALAGQLRTEHLYAIGFVVGTIEVMFVVAYQAYMPAIVPREALVDASSKLQMSFSAGQIAGPATAGILVSIVTAPIAIAVDVISFLVSAITLAWIRRPEPEPIRRPRALRRELREGFAGLLGHPILRPVVVMTAAALLAYSIYLSLIVLFHVRALGLDSVGVGTVFAIGASGALIGAAMAPRLARAIGIGPSLQIALVLATTGLLVTSQASGPPLLAMSIAATGQFALLFGASLFNVNGPALRAAVTPAHLLARVNATYRFLVWGLFPLGALLGGVIGEGFGLRAPLLTGAVICVAAFAWFARSPVSRLREVPTLVEA